VTLTEESINALLSVSIPPPRFDPARQLTFVNRLHQLREIEREFLCDGPLVVGVDVEHSNQSFHGYVCTLQISFFPAARVYVIDALVPEVRSFLLEVLNRGFSDPRVLKIVHGGNNDIKWLRSNFGFPPLAPLLDTGILAAQCGEKSVSLAELLRFHAGVDTSKKKEYQMGDWARRPLPSDWIEYAGQDAYYLPFLGKKLMSTLLGLEYGTGLEEGSPILPLLPSSLLHKCSAVQNCAVDVAQGEIFSPVTHLAKALKEAVNWRRESEGGIVSAKVVFECAAGEGAIVVGGTPCSIGELLFLATYLPVMKWRHNVALTEDISADLSIAPKDTLLRACREAVEGGEAKKFLRLSKYSDALLSTINRSLSTARSLPSLTLASQLNVYFEQQQGSLINNNRQVSGHSQLWERDKIKQTRAARIFTPRSSPLYSNCELLSPSGVVMARVDKAKAKWYLKKGIAEVVAVETKMGDVDDSEVLRIRLLREPKGTGHAGDVFHLQPRKNVCVVCGVEWQQQQQEKPKHHEESVVVFEERLDVGNVDLLSPSALDDALPSGVGGGNLVRCYIIPRGLRTHLPLAVKSYSNHDVLLTCMGCHRRADVSSGALLKRVASELGVSLSTISAHPDDPLTVSGASTCGMPTLSPPSNNEYFLFRKASLALVKWMSSSSTSLFPLPRLIDFLTILACSDAVRTAEIILEHGAEEESPQNSRRGRVNRKGKRKIIQQRAATAIANVLKDSGEELCSEKVEVKVDGGAADVEDEGFSRVYSVERANWKWLLNSIPQGLLGTVKEAGLERRHVVVLANTPISGAMSAWKTRVGSHSSSQPAARAAPDPMYIILKEVYSGGDAWRRAEKHYAGFSSARGGGVSITGLDVECESRLERFVKRWRKSFLDNLHPTSLPTAWGVDYAVFQAGSRTTGVKECKLFLEFIK